MDMKQKTLAKKKQRTIRLNNYLKALSDAGFYGTLELIFEGGLLVHWRKTKTHKGEEFDS